jgi:predicted dehydrogenase
MSPTPSRSSLQWLERLVKEHVPFTPADPLPIQLRHFFDVIRRDAEPLVSGEEGLATLRVIEAIKASARSGETIHLGEAQVRRGH